MKLYIALLLPLLLSMMLQAQHPADDERDLTQPITPATVATGTTPNDKTTQSSDPHSQAAILDSVRRAFATDGSSTDPLEGLKREWGKATHPSFGRAVTIDELGQALEADSEAILKFLRSSTLEAALRTALVTRASLMTGFVGESERVAQVLGVFREMADRNDLRQEDLYTLQIMQLAVPVRTKISVASDKDFQEWMQFAKSPNAAAKAIAVIAFRVLDATEPQRASFYQAFTSETNPILLQRLVRHLKSKSQYSQEASDALNALRSNLPPDHAAFQDN